MTDFGFHPDSPTILWCDNQSSIHISCNSVEHQRKKHIELHMHFIHQLIQDGSLILEYIPIAEHVADIFMKPFALLCYLQLHSMLGVKEVVLRGSLWGLPSFLFLSTCSFISFWRGVFSHWVFSFFLCFIEISLYLGTWSGLVARTHLSFF